VLVLGAVGAVEELLLAAALLVGVPLLDEFALLVGAVVPVLLFPEVPDAFVFAVPPGTEEMSVPAAAVDAAVGAVLLLLFPAPVFAAVVSSRKPGFRELAAVVSLFSTGLPFASVSAAVGRFAPLPDSLTLPGFPSEVLSSGLPFASVSASDGRFLSVEDVGVSAEPAAVVSFDTSLPSLFRLHPFAVPSALVSGSM
jgi:hypothetical protein